MRLNILTATLAAAIGLAATAASAAVVSYGDLAAFEAASSTTTIDFEGDSFVGLNTNSVGSLHNTRNPAGFSLGGATFTILDGGVYQAIVEPQFSPGLYDRGTGNVLHAERARGMRITFDSTATAFALDLSTIFRSVGSVLLTFSNGDSVSASLGNPFDFHGYTSDTGFDWVEISRYQTDYLLVDNIRWGQAAVAAVPLPPSMLFLGAGLLGLAAMGRRRR